MAAVLLVGRTLVAIALFTALPGISEAVEDAGHWLDAGHTVHDAEHDEGGRDVGGRVDVDGDGGAGDDCEHGCSGLQHLCRCCPSTQLIPTSVALIAGHATTGAAIATWSVTPGLGIDARAPALRPPIG